MTVLRKDGAETFYYGAALAFKLTSGSRVLWSCLLVTLGLRDRFSFTSYKKFSVQTAVQNI